MTDARRAGRQSTTTGSRRSSRPRSPPRPPSARAAPPHAPAAHPPAADEQPELAVGAAFAGGLVLALLLKRLAR